VTSYTTELAACGSGWYFRSAEYTIAQEFREPSASNLREEILYYSNGPVANESFTYIGIMGASGWNQHLQKDQTLISTNPLERNRSRLRPQILLVEDNRADVFLLQEAMELADVPADLHVVTDGERALGFIDEADNDYDAPCPSLVILDLNLPKKTGNEVLHYLRQSRKCRSARVLIVTSSDSEQDRASTAKLGADAYFRKPSGYDDYMRIGEIVKEMLTPTAEGEPPSI